jgi:hypothetical protein
VDRARHRAARVKPKRAKALDTPQGPRSKAEHPGTEGQDPLARAAAAVEESWPTLAQPSMQEWAAEIEANAKRHFGIE